MIEDERHTTSYRLKQLEGLRNRLTTTQNNDCAADSDTDLAIDSDTNDNSIASKTRKQQAMSDMRITNNNTRAKKGVQKYYTRQNKIITEFEELEEFIERTNVEQRQRTSAASNTSAQREDGDPQQRAQLGLGDEAELLSRDLEWQKQKRQEQLALRISFYTNVCLLAVKIFAAVQSGSLSIITSALDSFLDLISGLILYFTDKHMRDMNKYLYPIGKSRMQPLGILVFACIMGTLGFQVFIEGVQQLVGKEHTHHLEDLQLVIGIMISVICVKFLLFLYCRGSANRSVQTYAQDHRNDVITNTFGLIAAIVCDRLYYWVDPLGAMILAAYIVQNWSVTALENIKAMVGLSAPPVFLTKLTYLAWNSDPRILGVDTVRAYTFGPAFFVEVDVVLPEDMSLRVAHDIGEALQDRIEKLPEVERAFVHIDFETEHAPEHRFGAEEDRTTLRRTESKEKREDEQQKIKKIEMSETIPESPLARTHSTFRAALD